MDVSDLDLIMLVFRFIRLTLLSFKNDRLFPIQIFSLIQGGKTVLLSKIIKQIMTNFCIVLLNFDHVCKDRIL